MVIKAFIRIFVGLLILTYNSSILTAQYLPAKPTMSKNLMKDFINAHIEYPQKAIKAGDEGHVVISFSIDRERNISDRKVIESVSPEVDLAAIKLFDLILWEPATNNGKAVEGTGEFKLKYSISKYKSLVKKRGYDEIDLPFQPIDVSGEIYTVKQLDQMPEAIFDEGYNSLSDFISRNLVFPDAAEKLALKGEVKLYFIIETNGLNSNIMVAKPIGGGCTEEAIRIVQTLRWKPGIKEGFAVRTAYTITILFDPADQLRNKHIPNQSSSGI